MMEPYWLQACQALKGGLEENYSIKSSNLSPADFYVLSLDAIHKIDHDNLKIRVKAGVP
jgi:hypothetical protein